MSDMGIVNKLAVCCCCCQAACFAGQIFDSWGATQAQLQCELQCWSGCWTCFYPLCAKCEMGDTDKGTEKCKNGFMYCILCCGLCCVSPIDGCYNCIMYDLAVFGEGVSGWKNVTTNVEFLGRKVREAVEPKVS